MNAHTAHVEHRNNSITGLKVWNNQMTVFFQKSFFYLAFRTISTNVTYVHIQLQRQQQQQQQREPKREIKSKGLFFFGVVKVDLTQQNGPAEIGQKN
jgi:hypothetical protein